MSVDRAIAPAIRIPESASAPRPELLTGPGGVKLYTIQAGEQEVVRLSLVFRAGMRLQPRPFVASAAANLLLEGTERWSAREISEKMDFYGAYISAEVDRDYAVVTLVSLSKFFPQMLELFEQVIVHPTFPEEEVDIYKKKRHHHLAIEREKVSFRARELFGEALYGKGHPYGIYASPDEYNSLTADQIGDFYEARYHAGNCFAVSSGKASESEIQLMVDFLRKLPAGGVVDFAELPPAKPILRVTEEREGAVQSAIRVGKVLFGRTHPDFIGMQVVLTVLGGYFGSRLVQNLREERGYTYGVFGTMVNLESSGYMAIGTEVGAQFTADAVAQIFHEISRLRAELVTEEELESVKNTIAGEFMRILDGPFGIADVTIENLQNDAPEDYVDRFLHEVREITPERVKSLAERYLTEEQMVTVVVGSPEK